MLFVVVLFSLALALTFPIFRASQKGQQPGQDNYDGSGSDHPASAAAPMTDLNPPISKEEQAKREAAAAAEAAAQAAEFAARRAHEAEILKAAGEIRDRRSWLRVPIAAPEGKRSKVHWDHLLDEMVWLSKEFARERRWKLQQAKKVANQVARSNLDLESRVEVRAKEQEKTLRKRASWIAREVSTFWNKAQRVVQFKLRTEVEARKKEVLDRQLDVLLGQTQKYSSLLAQRLAVDERVEAVTLASKADDVVVVVGPVVATTAMEIDENDENDDGDDDEGAAAGPSSSSQHAKQRRALLPSPPQPPSAAVSGTGVDKDDSKEYRSGEDDDADDEATLEEEERMATLEGRNLKKDEKEEAAGLEEDADIPIEELLARYGYVVPNQEQAAAVAAAMNIDGEIGNSSAVAARGASAAAPDASDSESEQRLGVLLQDMHDDAGDIQMEQPSRLAAEFNYLSDEEEEGAGSVDGMRGEDSSGAGPSKPAAAGRQTRCGRTAAAGGAGGARPTPMSGRRAAGAGASAGASVDDDAEEYRSGEDDDADDEATLEEEERMATLEGRNLKKDEKEEAAGLEEDADIPIEELLARYGYVVPNQDDATEGGAAGAVQRNQRGATTTAIEGGGGGAPSQQQQHPHNAPVPEGEEEGEIEEVGGLEGTIELMAAAQPTGYTLDTTKVKTPVPFLLKGQLREYQHIGLDWLVTLYHRRLNGEQIFSLFFFFHLTPKIQIKPINLSSN